MPVHTTPFTPADPSQALRLRPSSLQSSRPRLRWRPCQPASTMETMRELPTPPPPMPLLRMPSLDDSADEGSAADDDYIEVIPRATTAAPMRSLAPPRRPNVPIRFLLRPLSALSARRHPLSLTMRSTRRFGRLSSALRASSCGTGATYRHTRPSSSSSSHPRASPSSAPSSPRIDASRCRAAASPTSRTRYTASSWPSMCPRR